MSGDFSEFTINIGLGINFLAFGTLFVTLRESSSYSVVISKNRNGGSLLPGAPLTAIFSLPNGVTTVQVIDKYLN